MALEHAIKSLLALSVGDSFGENELRIVPPHMGAPNYYHWTDDTAMAISVFRCLMEDGRIIQDKLAGYFAAHFTNDPQRGYGRGTANLLEAISQDGLWRERSANWWGPGVGSHGNGAAMRVAPLGAFYPDEVMVVAQAELQAKVTHDHPEAIAGAVAVALAASTATYGAWSWDSIIMETPKSVVQDKLIEAYQMRGATHLEVAGALGNGSQVTAMDTVPYCIWAACRALGERNFVVSMEQIASVGGDTDTNCAIVAGIIGNKIAPPDEWVQRTEPIPGFPRT